MRPQNVWCCARLVSYVYPIYAIYAIYAIYIYATGSQLGGLLGARTASWCLRSAPAAFDAPLSLTLPASRVAWSSSLADVDDSASHCEPASLRLC